MSFIQTQRLDYADHRDEIAFLNSVIAALPKPFPDVCRHAVELVLARIDHLMTCSSPTLSPYDPREERL
jgi:hypothetical protein